MMRKVSNMLMDSAKANKVNKGEKEDAR